MIMRLLWESWTQDVHPRALEWSLLQNESASERLRTVKKWPLMPSSQSNQCPIHCIRSAASRTQNGFKLESITDPTALLGIVYTAKTSQLFELLYYHRGTDENSFLRTSNLVAFQLSKNSWLLWHSEFSLSCSRKPAHGLCFEPDK